MEEEKILDWSTLELTKAVCDMLRYLQSRGILSAYAGKKDGETQILPDMVYVTPEFYERNFTGDKVCHNGMEIRPLVVDCASK